MTPESSYSTNVFCLRSFGSANSNLTYKRKKVTFFLIFFRVKRLPKLHITRPHFSRVFTASRDRGLTISRSGCDGDDEDSYSCPPRAPDERLEAMGPRAACKIGMSFSSAGAHRINCRATPGMKMTQKERTSSTPGMKSSSRVSQALPF